MSNYNKNKNDRIKKLLIQNYMGFCMCTAIIYFFMITIKVEITDVFLTMGFFNLLKVGEFFYEDKIKNRGKK